MSTESSSWPEGVQKGPNSDTASGETARKLVVPPSGRLSFRAGILLIRPDIRRCVFLRQRDLLETLRRKGPVSLPPTGWCEATSSNVINLYWCGPWVDGAADRNRGEERTSSHDRIPKTAIISHEARARAHMRGRGTHQGDGYAGISRGATMELKRSGSASTEGGPILRAHKHLHRGSGPVAISGRKSSHLFADPREGLSVKRLDQADAARSQQGSRAQAGCGALTGVSFCSPKISTVLAKIHCSTQDRRGVISALLLEPIPLNDLFKLTL